MAVSQDQFTQALFRPDAPVPNGLSDPKGRPAGKRFDVYRNNVAASLTKALETAFPVVAKLVGASNFKTLAVAYLRAHPPRTPLMMFYGKDMPAFLERFEPTAGTRYLPDVARLELALREAYHAEDARPIEPARLQALAPDHLMAARLRLAPALRAIRSDWPVFAIWRYNVEDGAEKPVMTAQDVAVVRPGFDPWPELLPPGLSLFLEALSKGHPFGAALDTAQAGASDFDLGGGLALMLRTGMITDIEE